jgi:hypothetical protein
MLLFYDEIYSSQKCASEAFLVLLNFDESSGLFLRNKKLMLRLYISRHLHLTLPRRAKPQI